MIRAIVIRHVADYAKWRIVFDIHQNFIKTAGAKNVLAGTAMDNPNMITIMSDWDTVEHLNATMANHELVEFMKEGGVIGQPRLLLLKLSPN